MQIIGSRGGVYNRKTK